MQNHGRQPNDRRGRCGGVNGGRTLLDLIERTLQADEQIKRYLHLTTTIDCWIDDLAQIAAGRFSPTIS